MPSVLVDTSNWVAHLRQTDLDMERLIQADDLMIHSVVIGELAVGNLKNRSQTMAMLTSFPGILELPPVQVYPFIDQHNLSGLGLSWGDVQLLASAVATGTPIWSIDKRLENAAIRLSVSWTP